MYDIEVIKCNLRKKGTSLASLSRSLQVTQSAVTQALKEQENSQRIVDTVAQTYMDLYGEPLPRLDSVAA
jgi:lambda repressor-like predicted transcriptional regulator